MPFNTLRCVFFREINVIKELLTAIQDWPALVQGVLGSAIFSLIVLVGQKVAGYVSKKIREHSKERQKIYLFNEIIRYRAVRDGHEFETWAPYASVLWFRASRHVISGLIWLTLGLIFEAISAIFGLIGFLGCLYYLFAAASIVKPIEFKGDIDTKIAELETELGKLNAT